MYGDIHQEDILKLDKIKVPVFVASKDYFNSTGEIIGCPIYSISVDSPLHIYIESVNVTGYVQCEKLALFDLNVRGFSKIDNLHIEHIMNITDAIQGIFDYI